jgi:hypothetical protein
MVANISKACRSNHSVCSGVDGMRLKPDGIDWDRLPGRLGSNIGFFILAANERCLSF